MSFDLTPHLVEGLPEPDAPWAGYPPYSFVGGHNDADSVPVSGLAEAAVAALAREGRDLASYNLGGSPLGYERLRTVIAENLAGRAGMNDGAEEVLIVSGSLQALDLVNGILVGPGDTVVVEEATYGGMLSRLAARGAEVRGVSLDEDGIVPEALDALFAELAAAGTVPKYLYTIPTVQNPTGSVMPLERRREILGICRRYEVPIFEDDCYADLTWDGRRPPSIRSLDDQGQVIYCGSFSKSIAPALRSGFLVADAPVIRQLTATKTDAGSGALEQLVLADYCAQHLDEHLVELRATLRAKCEAMTAAVTESFGSAASFVEPRGGIFLWLTFAEGIDTTALAVPAAAAGVEYNPGAGWSADAEWGRRHLRLCFGHPSPETIRKGIAVLADVFRSRGVL